MEVLKLLLQKKDTLWINEKHGTWGQYPLMVAAQNNSIEMVKILLKAGARTDVQDKGGKSPLMVTEDVEVAKILLSNGVPINLQVACDGWHALLYAMKDGLLFGLVEFLLEQGADLDLEADDGTTAKSILQNKRNVQVTP